MTTNPLPVALFAVAQAVGFLLLAPLLRGLIKKMKAAFQLRQGPRLLQPYSDLAKLLRKEPVRSTTASWVFVAGPRVYFASAVAATTLLPTVFAAAPLEAAGGILLLVGLLALGRFALATAALDTGSPFGGMGASREMTVGALAEPALMLALFTAGLSAGTLNLGRAGAARRGAGDVDPPERAAGGGGALHRAPRRGGPRAGRQPRHPPRADHDPRGHGARVQRRRPRPRRVGLRRQGAALHDAARDLFLPDRRRHEPRSAGAGDLRARARSPRSSLSR